MPPGGSSFRRLDDRLLPIIRRAFSASGSFVASPLRGLARWEQRLGHGRPLRALWRNRQFILLAAAVISFAGSFVHLQRYPDIRQAQAQGGGTSGPAPAPSGELPGEPFEESAAVGPPVGVDVVTYARERRAALDAATGDEERLAVVTFETYVTAEAVAEVLPDQVEVIAAQTRVPAEGQQPEEVPIEDGDLVATISERTEAAIATLAEEQAALEELLESDTVTDEAFAEQYRADIDELAATRNLLASGSGTVFAVVVRAPLPALRTLADASGVRLVDLAPAGVDPASSTFAGILPEDQDTASFGVTG